MLVIVSIIVSIRYQMLCFASNLAPKFNIICQKTLHIVYKLTYPNKLSHASYSFYRLNKISDGSYALLATQHLSLILFVKNTIRCL